MTDSLDNKPLAADNTPWPASSAFQRLGRIARSLTLKPVIVDVATPGIEKHSKELIFWNAGLGKVDSGRNVEFKILKARPAGLVGKFYVDASPSLGTFTESGLYKSEPTKMEFNKERTEISLVMDFESPQPQQILVTGGRQAGKRTVMNALQFAPKQHKKKRWMSDSYHKRIQKKWNKRGLKEAIGKVVTLNIGSTFARKLRELAAKVK